MSALSIFLSAFLSFAFAAPDSPAVIGIVEQVKGEVSLIRAGATSTLQVGNKLQEADQIETKEHSAAKLLMTDHNIFMIQELSDFRLSEYQVAQSEKPGKVSIDLTQGALHSVISEKYDDQEHFFHLNTQGAVAGIRGTEFLAEAVGDHTQITTFSGKVAVGEKDSKDLSKAVEVGPGQQFAARPGHFDEKIRTLSKKELNGLKNQAHGMTFQNGNTGGNVKDSAKAAKKKKHTVKQH